MVPDDPGRPLGEMERAAAGRLGDLGAAAEAVGEERGGGIGAADGGEEGALGDGERYMVMVAGEAESAGHAAAAGVEEAGLGAEAGEERTVGREPHHRVVMAVRVDEHRAGRVERGETDGVAAEATRSGDGLRGEAAGVVVL